MSNNETPVTNLDDLNIEILAKSPGISKYFKKDELSDLMKQLSGGVAPTPASDISSIRYYVEGIDDNNDLMERNWCSIIKEDGSVISYDDILENLTSKWYMINSHKICGIDSDDVSILYDESSESAFSCIVNDYYIIGFLDNSMSSPRFMTFKKSDTLILQTYTASGVDVPYFTPKPLFEYLQFIDPDTNSMISEISGFLKCISIDSVAMLYDLISGAQEYYDLENGETVPISDVILEDKEAMYGHDPYPTLRLRINPVTYPNGTKKYTEFFWGNSGTIRYSGKYECLDNPEVLYIYNSSQGVILFLDIPEGSMEDLSDQDASYVYNMNDYTLLQIFGVHEFNALASYTLGTIWKELDSDKNVYTIGETTYYTEDNSIVFYDRELDPDNSLELSVSYS